MDTASSESSVSRKYPLHIRCWRLFATDPHQSIGHSPGCLPTGGSPFSQLLPSRAPAPNSLLEALCHRSTPLPAFVASPRDFHQPLRLLASFYPPEHPPPNSLLEPLCHRSTPLSRLCSLASPRDFTIPSAFLPLLPSFRATNT